MLASYIIIMIAPILIAPLMKEGISTIKVIFILTIPLAFFLGASIGGNDICNAMGTCFGSKTLTMR